MNFYVLGTNKINNLDANMEMKSEVINIGHSHNFGHLS